MYKIHLIPFRKICPPTSSGLSIFRGAEYLKAFKEVETSREEAEEQRE